jgi:RNA processing factor Prp31
MEDYEEGINPNVIHIVKMMPCEGGKVRAVISTTANQANPVALYDQIEAQTKDHLTEVVEWYTARVQDNPDSDGLERYVNLIGHIELKLPEEYVSNLLARAVQDKVRTIETSKRISHSADKLAEQLQQMLVDMQNLTDERDMLRDLVIQYQSAISDAE